MSLSQFYIVSRCVFRSKITHEWLKALEAFYWISLGFATRRNSKSLFPSSDLYKCPHGGSTGEALT